MTAETLATNDIDERPVTVTKLGEIVAAHMRLERALSQLTRIERAVLADLICDIRIAGGSTS
jgi:hypothetical protein